MSKLKIEFPEERIKETFKLKKSSFENLNFYSNYLSELYKKEVNLDVIMDSLIDSLNKDSAFSKYKKNLLSKNEDKKSSQKKPKIDSIVPQKDLTQNINLN